MGTIEEAWDEYRAWAKRSRTLQRTLNRWNLAAAGAAILAAVLGAAAVGSKLELSSLLSGLATVAALVAAAGLDPARYELLPGAESAGELWDALLDAARPLGGMPCGLGSAWW